MRRVILTAFQHIFPQAKIITYIHTSIKQYTIWEGWEGYGCTMYWTGATVGAGFIAIIIATSFEFPMKSELRPGVYVD